MKNGLALLAAFVGGVAAGAAAGLLLAPEKGEDQRKKLAELFEKGKNELKKVAEETTEKIKSLKNGVATEEEVDAD